MSMPTIEGTQELMQHPQVALILATGGSGLVKAAYSSGKPAYGVGPGNVPVFIEQTANVEDAVRKIVEGKCFDNGTICSSEQAVVVEHGIKDLALSEFARVGGYLLSLSLIHIFPIELTATFVPCVEPVYLFARAEH